MCEELEDHEGSVSIRGRLITNFRFADDIVVNAEEQEEAGVLVDCLDTTTTRYKMEIGPDQTKVMTNNPNGFQREIKIKGQRLEEVENFKYLEAIISNEGSKPEILSRIAQTTAVLSRLKIIWRDKNISLASKVKLMQTLILSTFLYACESWTLTAEIKRRIQALEMRCYRRLLNISNKDHVTNEEVRKRIQNAIGVQDDLLTMVKKRKLRWYGHISRSSGMAKTILQTFHLISSQSLNLGGRRGTTDDVATIPFHPSLTSTALRKSPNPIPIHSLMLSSHLFFFFLSFLLLSMIYSN